ncbi:MAG TPA: septal ring lytic transglycosylase RlpA family protein, partial [Arenimonas sp.]|nr:septal ring lytic transglycosylase RlpA family protein [Arenimonas sp.]
ALVCLLLAACASAPKPSQTRQDEAQAVRGDAPEAAADAVSSLPSACLQVREHRDEDYTPGGLYAPAVRDSAPDTPLDISGLPEPEPRDEPPSAYGNRSPYTVLGKRYHVRDSARGYRERGVASWYGQKFHGRLTSSREPYDMCSFSAAHKTLPLPSYVRVTNLDNGRSAVVRVNDRGPFHDGRIIDLSYAAAIKLGVDRTGTARVEVEALAGLASAGERPTPVVRAENVRPAAEPRRVVQVGSYGDRANARAARDRLRAAGIDDVDMQAVEVDGRTLWRVRIGPLAAGTALALVERVRALGFPGPRVFSD